MNPWDWAGVIAAVWVVAGFAVAVAFGRLARRARQKK